MALLSVSKRYALIGFLGLLACNLLMLFGSPLRLTTRPAIMQYLSEVMIAQWSDYGIACAVFVSAVAYQIQKFLGRYAETKMSLLSRAEISGVAKNNFLTCVSHELR
jgi:hypothetical protein